MNLKCNFSLKEVHDLSKTKDINDTAMHLKVTPRILKRFIARFILPNIENKQIILNFGYLSYLNGLTPNNPLWEKYTAINGGEIRDFEKMTIRQVHLVCQASSTFDDCANALNIWPETLDKWFKTMGTSVHKFDKTDFEKFSIMSEDEARTIFGDTYLELIQLPTFKVQNYTLNQVHATLLQRETLKGVALKLNVTTDELHSFFSLFMGPHDTPLTTGTLKEMTIEEAGNWFEELYGSCEEKISSQADAKKTDLSNKSLKEIHEATVNLTTSEAASKLDVSIRELKIQLARFTYTNSNEKWQFLDFDTLKAMDANEATRLFNNEYSKINGGKEADLKNLTLKEFHELCQTSNSLSAMALVFRRNPKTFNRLISQLPVDNSQGNTQNFTFDYLKGLSTQDAERDFGQHYNKTMGSRDIESKKALPELTIFKKIKPNEQEVSVCTQNNKNVTEDWLSSVLNI